MRKPDAPRAMGLLVDRLRRDMPFDVPAARVCQDSCRGCSIKLLGYLESELDAWEQRLADGERPGLAELSKLMRLAARIHRALARNGLVTT